MKHRLNIYFSADLLERLGDLAAQRGLTKSSIVEAALASFLSPDAADRREAVFVRRLDRDRKRSVPALSHEVSDLQVGRALPIVELADIDVVCIDGDGPDVQKTWISGRLVDHSDSTRLLILEEGKVSNRTPRHVVRVPSTEIA